MSYRLRLCALLVALFAITGFVFCSPSRAASTTFGFAAADSAQQFFYASDESSDYTVKFLLHGGSANTGLTLGVAKTIHVGVGDLSGSAGDDSGPPYHVQIFSNEPLPHALSLTGTVGTVTQTLPQTDDLTTVPVDSSEYDSTQTVDVHAGPTVTFDMGTQGRIDVTPQEYKYSRNSDQFSNPTNPPAPKFAYTLLLRSPAVPVAGVSVSPSTVTYPASAMGAVTLIKPAPDAETVVLKSSNPAVGVPATLAVAAGQQTVTFPITTDRVDSDTAVTVSAAAGGTTKSATLTVKTRPETAFTYNIPGQPEIHAYGSSGGEVIFSATGGSGTVKLALDTPYTIPVGAYHAQGYTGGPDYESASLDTTISRAVSVSGASQSLPQDLSLFVQESSFRGTFRASLSDGPTLVYDLGGKGRIELAAIGFSHSDDNYGVYDGPAQYTFTLRAPNAASSLLVSPAKVYGGATSYGKVTLVKAAGLGGQTVTLTTSDPSAASVPASVVVPEGVKSAVFPITTYTVDEDTAVAFTESSGGKSLIASLTVLARYAFSGTVKSGSAGLSGVSVNAASTGAFTLTSTATPSAAIPDSSTTGVSSSLVPKGSGTISGLVVGVDITHPYIGDLRVTLKGPDGTTAVLYDQSGGSQKNILASYPVLRAPVDSLSVFNGKQVAGTWTLLVQDLGGGDIGTFNAWNLTFTYQGTYTSSGTTASDGTYTVSDLKEGTYTATPVKSGASFTPSSRSVTVGPGVVDPNPDGIDFARK